MGKFFYNVFKHSLAATGMSESGPFRFFSAKYRKETENRTFKPIVTGLTYSHPAKYFTSIFCECTVTVAKLPCHFAYNKKL